MAVIQSRQRSNPQKPHDITSAYGMVFSTPNQEKKGYKTARLKNLHNFGLKRALNMLRGDMCIKWNRQTIDITTENVFKP